MTDKPMIDDDDALAELVTNALGELPQPIDVNSQPPASLIEGAKWVHEWVTMDAELAELTFDSTTNPELAGVRSLGALRELTFVSGQHTIEVEIDPNERTVTISGHVEPPVTGTMQLVIGGEIFEDELDETGSFCIEHVVHGTVLAFIQTPSGKIRLGSFEV